MIAKTVQLQQNVLDMMEEVSGSSTRQVANTNCKSLDSLENF